MTRPGLEPLRQAMSSLTEVLRQLWRDEELSVPGQCVAVGAAVVLASGLLGGSILWAGRAALL